MSLQIDSSPILVVDDIKEFRLLMLEYLNGQGIPVVLAPDGNTAFTLLEERNHQKGLPPYRMVISDLSMSNGSGIDLLNKIRSSINHDIPFVLMSGHISREDLTKILPLEPDLVLIKPFEMATLIGKLSEAEHKRNLKTINRIMPQSISKLK